MRGSDLLRIPLRIALTVNCFLSAVTLAADIGRGGQPDLAQFQSEQAWVLPISKEKPEAEVDELGQGFAKLAIEDHVYEVPLCASGLGEDIDAAAVSVINEVSAATEGEPGQQTTVTACPAARAEANRQQTSFNLLHSDLRRTALSYLDLAEYLMVLGSFDEESRKKSRLPLGWELKMLKQSKNSSLAKDLAKSWVDDIMLTKAEGKEIEKLALGRSLEELIAKVYEGPDFGESKVLDECRFAIVADKRLDAAAWEEYAEVAVRDIVDNPDLGEAATKRLGTVVAMAAAVGSVSAITAAVSRAEQEGIEVDLAAGGNDAISLASEKGHVGVVKFLLGKKEEDTEHKKHGYWEIDPAARGNWGIMGAIANGHIDMVVYLFGKKESDDAEKYGYENIDPAAGANCAIQSAVANGYIDMVKLLLGKKEREDAKTYGYEKIDPAVNDSVAIQVAAESGHVDMVEFLRERQAAKPDLYVGLVLDY